MSNVESAPIKRHKALQQFSRDYHFALLLGWKIRQGFRNNIELERIKKYTDWYFETYLKPLFDSLENYIYPLLPDENKSKKRALAEQRKLERLFNDNKDFNRSLNLIEELLDQNVRFVERKLFKEIQETVSEEKLEEIEDVHQSPGDKPWADEFWVEK